MKGEWCNNSIQWLALLFLLPNIAIYYTKTMVLTQLLHNPMLLRRRVGGRGGGADIFAVVKMEAHYKRGFFFDSRFCFFCPNCFCTNLDVWLCLAHCVFFFRLELEFEWMALSTTQWCPLSTHNLLLFAWCSRSVRWQLILSIKGGVDKLAIPFNLLHPLLSGLQKSVIVKGAYKIGGCVCVYLYKLKYVCFEKLWFYGMDKRGGGATLCI